MLRCFPCKYIHYLLRKASRLARPCFGNLSNAFYQVLVLVWEGAVFLLMSKSAQNHIFFVSMSLRIRAMKSSRDMAPSSPARLRTATSPLSASLGPMTSI